MKNHKDYNFCIDNNKLQLAWLRPLNDATRDAYNATIIFTPGFVKPSFTITIDSIMASQKE